MSVNIQSYEVYPGIDGKERPNLNNLNSPQLFIIISFTDRLLHLNYRSTLLWQILYYHGTKNGPCSQNAGQEKGKI